MEGNEGCTKGIFVSIPIPSGRRVKKSALAEITSLSVVACDVSPFVIKSICIASSFLDDSFKQK